MVQPKHRNFFAKAVTRIRPQVVPDKRREKTKKEAWRCICHGMTEEEIRTGISLPDNVRDFLRGDTA